MPTRGRRRPKAEAFDAQVRALGANATALVNVVESLSKSGTPIVPNILVTGGGGTIEALAATLLKNFAGKPLGYSDSKS